MERTIEPEIALLRYAICEQPWEEWYKSPNAEATLEYVLDDDDDSPATCTLITKEETLQVSAAYPSMMIKQPDPGSFFLYWIEGSGHYVPYNGEPCEEYTLDHCGGEDMRIPLACLVGTAATLDIIEQFLANQTRSNNVTWARWEELDLPEEWFE